MKTTERDTALDAVSLALNDLPRLAAPTGLATSVILLAGSPGLLSHGAGRALVSVNLALLVSLSALYLLVVPSPASALSPVPPLTTEARAQTPPYTGENPSDGGNFIR